MNLSLRGRRTELEDMQLHRTEMLTSPRGHLAVVTYVGVYPHEGEMRDLVLGLKYGKTRNNAFHLAKVLASHIPELQHAGNILTWAPTTSEHIRERGMDHAELIARHVGALTGQPVKKMLRRTSVSSQTGSGRSERLARPQFVARPLGGCRGVVVIDDVLTTGATFRAAAMALVGAGANSVLCCAPSRTR
jgi:predicted amidophosphoribosyltransferase